MRIFKEEVEYQGSPEEIAEFFRLTTLNVPEQTPYAPEDFTPLESTVNESAELRKKLAEDPSYNPFGGVVPPKESEELRDANINTFMADEELGVKLEP